MQRAYTTAALCDVSSFDGRAFSFGSLRRIVGVNAVLGLAAIATVGVLIVTVTLVAAWIVSTTPTANRGLHAKTSMGPGALALVPVDPTSAVTASMSFEAKWARAQPGAKPRPIEVPENVAKVERNREPVPTRVAKLTPERANIIPLPRSHPAPRDVARLPSGEPAKVAVAPPPPVPAAEKPIARQQAHNREPVLSEADKRTAVYDISARTVYMPNGDKLEAHSGLGEKMDNPRYTKIRMRGPTPPNVYELTMRERLFHGVRAIRLNPVDEGRMFGRDGMLAHTYLLGPNGQSNGCVSFKSYDKFLQAFLDGKVDRLVVVPELGQTPWRMAVAQHSHVRRRYAASSRTDVTGTVTASAVTW